MPIMPFKLKSERGVLREIRRRASNIIHLSSKKEKLEDELNKMLRTGKADPIKAVSLLNQYLEIIAREFQIISQIRYDADVETRRITGAFNDAPDTIRAFVDKGIISQKVADGIKADFRKVAQKATGTLRREVRITRKLKRAVPT